MSPDQQFWLAVIVQVAALVLGLATLWFKVEGVHVSVNSRMDQLVDQTAKASRAEGVASMMPPLPGPISGDAAPPVAPV